MIRPENLLFERRMVGVNQSCIPIAKFRNYYKDVSVVSNYLDAYDNEEIMVGLQLQTIFADEFYGLYQKLSEILVHNNSFSEKLDECVQYLKDNCRFRYFRRIADNCYYNTYGNGHCSWIEIYQASHKLIYEAEHGGHCGFNSEAYRKFNIKSHGKAISREIFRDFLCHLELELVKANSFEVLRKLRACRKYCDDHPQAKWFESSYEGLHTWLGKADMTEIPTSVAYLNVFQNTSQSNIEYIPIPKALPTLEKHSWSTYCSTNMSEEMKYEQALRSSVINYELLQRIVRTSTFCVFENGDRNGHFYAIPSSDPEIEVWSLETLLRCLAENLIKRQQLSPCAEAEEMIKSRKLDTNADQTSAESNHHGKTDSTATDFLYEVKALVDEQDETIVNQRAIIEQLKSELAGTKESINK